jgi:uncharacterized coiled-coil DUF342 family protein
MSVETMPELTHEKGGDFVALEEKVYRTIELLKTAREARAAAEHEASELRESLQVQDEQLESLRDEVKQLRRERDEVRTRVEKILKQIDQLTEEQTAS